jgi:redox-sensing transcriptional repressor
LTVPQTKQLRAFALLFIDIAVSILFYRYLKRRFERSAMAAEPRPHSAPLPVVRRLPAYLWLLRKLQAAGREWVSGTHLGAELELEPIQVRKDLSFTGVVGRPRVGFNVCEAIASIEAFLNWNNTRDAVVVGAGHLGAALLGYQGFHFHGLELVAGFDTNPARLGTIHGKPVLPMSQLASLVKRLHVRMAILTVPADQAQQATDELVHAGIGAIWNFTPVRLRVPDQVVVHDEDLAAGLAVLSIKLVEADRARLGPPRRADGDPA